MRKRFFSVLVMLTFLLSWTGVAVGHAAPRMPDLAPKDTTQTLVGFDAPTFHARHYAYLTEDDPQGVRDVEELSLSAQPGSIWKFKDLTVAALP